MGTCNFVTQSDFDLYIYDEDLDNTLDEDEAIAKYNSGVISVFEAGTHLAKEFNKELIFHDIEIECGYYTGIQTYIKNYYNDIEYFDNDDCHYHFNMCRSKALRKYKAEVKRINKRLLPKFKTELGFEQIKLVGVFSNGEAIYQRVN